MPHRGTTISVALCTHNGEQFIAEQLLSILSQSLPPAEIIMSDDASTDRTVECARGVAENFLDHNPEVNTRFRVLENLQPLGVAANFEQAISECSADVIALSDQDDLWAADRLERVATEFDNRSELLLLHSDARLIDESGAPLPHTLFDALEVSRSMKNEIHAGEAFRLLLKRNLVTGATTVFRRSLFDVARPFPESWLHDEWLAIVAAATGRLDFLEETLVDYRQHDANQIGVSKLSFAGKTRRMIEPGATRNLRLLERATALADRFAKMGGLTSKSYAEVVQRKLAHEIVRAGLSVHRLFRVVPVVRQLASGDYSRFGRGGLDAIRDLTQSLVVPG